MPLIHAPTARPWNKKSVIFIHGVGLHKPGYAEPLYQTLLSQNSSLVDASRWYELSYDRADPTLEKKAIDFQKALPAATEDLRTWPSIGQRLIEIGLLLFTADFHRWIQKLFQKEMMRVMADGRGSGVNEFEHGIYFVTHSLGSVLAYEFLHNIITDTDSLGWTAGFRVKQFFTLGSPLAFIRHNRMEFPNPKKYFHLLSQPIARPWTEVAPFGKVSNIQDWANIRHESDPVANLVPLDKINSNNAVTADVAFSELRAGKNPHDFASYLAAQGPLIVNAIEK
jgi:hypothetical protein